MDVKLKLSINIYILLYIQLNHIFSITALNCVQVLSKELKEEIQGYQNIADKIFQAVKSEPFQGRTYKNLASFVDQFGARFTGSDILEKSIDWAVEKFKEDKLENVETEDVTVLHWVR